MLITTRARKGRGSPVVATMACFAGALALDCAPLDGAAKLRCRTDADCIGGYECRNEQCLIQAENCDPCLVGGLFRPPCSVPSDSAAARDEEAKQRGFVVYETYGRFLDEASPSWSRPGYDLDCSQGTENPAEPDDQLLAPPRFGACETTLFGESPPDDPELGVDNSFLRTFLPSLAYEGNVGSLEISTGSGAWRMLVALTGYNGQPYDSEVNVSILYADRFEETGTTPSVGTPSDATRRWGIEASLSYPDGLVPLFRDVSAHVSDYQVVAKLVQPGRDPTMTLKLFVTDGDGPAEVLLRLRDPALTFTLASRDGKLTGLMDGVLSGTWYESQWPDDIEEYDQAVAMVSGDASVGGGLGGQGGSSGAASDSSSERGGSDGDLEAGLDGGTTGASPITEGVLIPFAERFGHEVVLPALAASLDMHYQTNADSDATVCNAVSLAIGLRGIPVEFSCPAPGSGTFASDGTATQSMAVYGECSLASGTTGDGS